MTENLANVALDKARFNMIEQQVRPWDVLDVEVLELMQAVPREVFVPAAYAGVPFVDSPVPIGEGQVMLPPVIVGRLLQALQIKTGENVLQVGAGGGYITACLAQNARQVTVVDAHSSLAKAAGDALAAAQVENVALVTAECHAGYGTETYDAIVITGAMPDVPQAYLRQLKPGGRLFVVTGCAPVMTAQLITHTSQENYTTKSLFETELPDLSGVKRTPAFEL